ncbi:hypothetical protein LTR08_001010 [Meristemomyces frigidus]|nr:hypothetical protein LTR08_001010 [Meristemomyces frigidus]
MPLDRVLRLRRTDKEGEHLLVNVSRSGVRPLDLKLVASEGEVVYPGKIKEINVKSLQASNYSGNLDDWKAILTCTLLQERVEGTPPSVCDGVETVASVNGTTLTITIRKNISGITQRLGAIVIEENDAEEIDIFGWTCTAVASADALRDQLETLQTSVSSQQEQVAKLRQQLNDLVNAKKEHEDELLKKFATLLNAKKLKIRNQQRLLAGAKIDPEAGGAVSIARSGVAGGKAAGKRKADAPDAEEAAADEDTATEDDEDELGGRVETPHPSDDDATDDSDQEGFEAAAAPSQASRRSVRSSGKASAVVKTTAKGGDAMEIERSVEPTPPRALPFTRKNAVKPPVPRGKPEPAAAAADEDDDDTDEEL